MATGQSVSSTESTRRILLRTLGPLQLVELLDTGEERAISPGGKALAMLAYLACAPSRSTYRERLAELLWANSDTESALQSLRQARLVLRRLAGDEIVLLDGDALTLAPCVSVDRDEFMELLARKELHAAVQLYRGPFCDRFAAPGAEDFEQWVDAERSTLKLRAVEAIDRLASLALSEARASDALALATRLRAADEDDERHWRIRLEALLLKRDQFGARVASSECREWLQAERREPTRALRALIDRAAAASVDAEHGDGRDADAHRLHPDLAGREEQFATLLESWREAQIGRGRSVVLVGASGHGKTRLLRDVEERLTATRARTVSVRALPADETVRFALASRVAAALAGMRGAAGLSDASAAVLLALNPSLSSAFRSAQPATLRADPLLSILEALDELLGVLAEESPLAVLIDDLHWADAASAQIVLSLCERVDTRRILCVLTVRNRAVGSPRLPTSAQIVKVEPLTPDETDALLASIARLPERIADDWKAVLHRTTGGSPLLILETLRLAMDAGHLAIGPDGWVVVNAPSVITMLSQRTVLADRLKRLDAEARALATLLAVTGRPLPLEALEQANSIAAADVLAMLSRLELRDVAARHREGWVIAHDALAESLVATADAEQLDLARLGAARALARVGDATSATHSMLLLVRLGRWAEGAAEVSRIAQLNASTGQSGFRLARGALARIEDPRARKEVQRRLPPSLRFPKFAVAVVGVIALVLTAGMVAISMRDPLEAHESLSQLVVYGASPDGTPIARVVPISNVGWTTARPIDARRAEALLGWHRGAHGPLSINPSNRAVAVERLYPDSGQVDVTLRTADGREERLTSTRGDDVPVGWAPDGSVLLIESAREGSRGHRAIWAMDMATRAVRRISSGGTATESDQAGQWSPDGSRIAFIRKFFDVREDELCVVDSDGQAERCHAFAGRSPIDLGPWLDPTRVVVRMDSAGVHRADVVHLSEWSQTPVAPSARGCRLSPRGLWLSCSGTPMSPPTVTPAANPDRVRRVLVPQNLQRLELGWTRSASDPGVVASVVVRSPIANAPVGVGTLLEASALDRLGDPVDSVPLRWESLDPGQATVADGLLIPRKAGSVRVRVSAGGWRTAELTVRAVDSPTVVDLREDWGSEVELRWAFFGSPRPTIVQDKGRRSFWTRGDGDFFSGAYSRAQYPIRDGLWVEAELSTRITAPQWQSAMLFIDAIMDPAALHGWDREDASFPPGAASLCAFIFPAGEGMKALNNFFGAGDLAPVTGVPMSRLRDGRWYRVLLQLFPDGRCGMAIDGAPVLVHRGVALKADSAILHLQGSSFETRILVGPMVAGRGVRRDVRWELLPTTTRR